MGAGHVELQFAIKVRMLSEVLGFSPRYEFSGGVSSL